VRQEDFISKGMFQIAKPEEQEWRLKEEIREMLFRNQQPGTMRAAIKEIKLKNRRRRSE
jgi:hypothetical protein